MIDGRCSRGVRQDIMMFWISLIEQAFLMIEYVFRGEMRTDAYYLPRAEFRFFRGHRRYSDGYEEFMIFHYY